MKMIRLFTVLILLALTLVSASLVQAQKNNPKCGPLSPEAVEEIIATRGSAVRKYCPDYVVMGVAAAKSVSSTRAMVEEIAATRGAAASKYFGQQMQVIIPVTSSDRQLAPTQAEIERIIATRGEWNMGNQGK